MLKEGSKVGEVYDNADKHSQISKQPVFGRVYRASKEKPEAKSLFSMPSLPL